MTYELTNKVLVQPLEELNPLHRREFLEVAAGLAMEGVVEGTLWMVVFKCDGTIIATRDPEVYGEDVEVVRPYRFKALSSGWRIR